MRAIQVAELGGPDVLRVTDTADPVPAANEALVEVSVASMTFIETKIRAGEDPWHPAPDLPYVPGGLVGGTVRRVGDPADERWVGARVVAETGSTGGYAELAVATTDTLFEVPHGLGLADAVALYSDGATAQGLTEGARIGPGEWVLVEASAGGVGSLLVQLARLAGANVIGAASGSKLDVVSGLGADVAVDYTVPGWARHVLDATGGRGPDVVFDGVGGDVGRTAFELTARTGRFSVHGASSGTVTAVDAGEAERAGVELIGIEQLFGFGPRVREWATKIMAEAAAGRVRPVIGQTFPLDRATDAHRAIEERTSVGKTLLTVRP